MKDCNEINQSCTSTSGPNYGLNRDGSEKEKSKNGCVINARGIDDMPRPTDYRCKEFQLNKDQKSNQYIDQLVNEALNIGGATINVFKLLGVHEQGKLIDCTGRGKAISNGDSPNFPADNAFDKFISEWRSIQRGQDVITSSFIGYDFGNIKTKDQSREAYGIETNIFKHITSIAIKQSSNKNRRITKARIERSNDGKKWYGVDIVILPDDDCLNTLHFRDSVPSRYWRIRPLEFNGLETNDVWSVVALQMFHNYIATDQYNIQDKIFLENRDRQYADEPIPLKGYYDLQDNISDLTNFGIELPSLTLYIDVSFSACVAALDRPIVVGDIIEIPSEAQYSAKLEKILKWMEVTDVSWSTSGYTPGWQPTLLRIVAQPAIASQETQDIFGDLAENILDELGTVDGHDGNNPIYQDYSDVSQTLEAEANDDVPERGADGSNTIRAWEEDEILAAKEQGINNLQKLGLYPTGLYVEDAMPPNNEPYTEGEEFPENPKHGDYHRMIYTGMAEDIPARLYRYSESKGRWIYLETDKRAFYDPAKPTLKEFITSSNSVKFDEISRTRETIDKNCEED